MHGARIGITAARRAAEQEALVHALGGVAVLGATVDLDAAASPQAVHRAITDVVDARLDIAVFHTGVGVRHTLAAADRCGRFDDLMRSLASARVVARGHKARRALHAAGIAVDAVASPPESAAVRDLLLGWGVAGRRIMVQCIGPEDDPMVGPLRAGGADVVTVHPYDIAPPSDSSAGRRLASMAACGELDAVAFTSASAVAGFVSLAAAARIDLGRLNSGRCVVTSVGPVTTRALREQGLRVDVEPRVPRMGAMYQALAGHLGSRSIAA